MNFFKRALTSIKRRPGKTVILLLLVFILGTVISGAVSVRGAVDSTENNLRSRMRPIVSFMTDEQRIIDWQDETGEWPDHIPLTPEMVREIGDLDYVRDFHYSIDAGIQTDSLEEWWPWMEGGGHIIHEGSQRAWLNVMGTSTPEPLQVREEFIIMADGRTFTEEEVATAGDVHPILLSTGFARHNNLSLNSEFDITLTIMHLQEAEIVGGAWDPEWENNPDNIFMEETFTFEVIGLFDGPEVDPELDPNSEEAWQAQMRAEQHLSALFVPNVTAEILSRFEHEGRYGALVYAIENGSFDLSDLEWFNPDADFEHQMRVTSIMELGDASDLEAFREAAEEILPEFMVVEDLSNTFSDISSSMDNLQGIAQMVLWVAVGATLLILSLLITLFLRDRRHEMGVYLALGEKKSKIISQILVEVVATAFIGITLAVFTGSLISSSMSRTMLRNELAAEQTMDMGWSFGGGGLAEMGFAEDMSIEDMIDAFDVSLNFGTISLFYVVGLGAVILSTIAPVMYVVTLNPKKVLM